MKPPYNFEVTSSVNHTYGYMVVTLWDTIHTEILDCWRIEDHDDEKKFRKELEELMR